MDIAAPYKKSITPTGPFAEAACFEMVECPPQILRFAGAVAEHVSRRRAVSAEIDEHGAIASADDYVAPSAHGFLRIANAIENEHRSAGARRVRDRDRVRHINVDGNPEFSG